MCRLEMLLAVSKLIAGVTLSLCFGGVSFSVADDRPLSSVGEVRIIEGQERQVLAYQSIRYSVAVTMPPGSAYSNDLDPLNRLVFYRNRTPRDRPGRDFVLIGKAQIAASNRGVAIPLSVSSNSPLQSPAAKELTGFTMHISVPISTRNLLGGGENFRIEAGTATLTVTDDPTKDESLFKDDPHVNVRIVEPESETDVEALAKIRSNRYLELSLHEPATAHLVPILPELKGLIQRYPRSSYADYCRLSVAAQIAGTEDRFLPRKYDPVPDIRSLMKRRKSRDHYELLAFHPNRTREEIDQAIDLAIESAEGTEAEQARAAGGFAKLFEANADDRREAVKHLQEIKDPDFAHMPAALLLLRKLYKIDQPDKVAEVTKTLNVRYANSIEWLRERQTDMSTAEWRKFRVFSE